MRWQNAQGGFRQAELGVLLADGDIRHTGQAKAATEHCAFEHGDQHLWGVLRFFQQAAEGAIKAAVGIATGRSGTGHVLDIATGAEVPTGTAQDNRAHAQIIAQAFQHRAQFADHGQAHGIAAVRAIKGDMQHAGVEAQQQGFAVRSRHFIVPLK